MTKGRGTLLVLPPLSYVPTIFRQTPQDALSALLPPYLDIQWPPSNIRHSRASNDLP